MIMEHDAAKEYLRGKLEDYLISYCHINPRTNFKCFNSIAHSHGDRKPSMHYYRDTNRCICFACGENMDIFEIIRIQYGYDSFSEAFQKACSLYGIQIRNGSWNASRKSCQSDYARKMPASIEYHRGKRREIHTKVQKPPFPDQTDYYKLCVERRKQNAEARNYLYSRGLSDDILDRFLIGYDPSWHHPKTRNMNTKRIIIPNSPIGYLARVIDDAQTLEEYDHRKMKVGPQGPFNLKAIHPERVIFVVEGEIDAMSIEEFGIPSVGLGSISHYKKLVNYCIENPYTVKDTFFLIALDNDQPGIKRAAELSMLFVKNGIRCARYQGLSGIFKDPNERLVKDRCGMEDELMRVYQNCQYIRRFQRPEHLQNRA